ncbi:cysteinyl-tRNA synthetase [Suhomyces tanzawaensis NRRL Y-17324]|uniref:cysteine--tRNA ligase n=1 Tax=Suhomyces tanzawaensis NRRL Y-17324 TaxID=984487 RepID=A0A1E4SES7_9ASCO|nr:cysteinyl-tRNA synthetase [Suhomyces tanzawaensis NRRL Y-17324]ODV77966.1 cysteinyl-tRNA synthetase [Suhomyces tanzawaensis NRRL Y-17324]
MTTVKKSVQQPQWHAPQPPASKTPLKLYNSLTRTKTEFVPIVPGHISWYCCGPTVYDHSHMGHARNYVSSDLCRRILQDYFGYNVKFIQNVTDIDDKIIIAARQEYLFEEKIVSQFSSVSEQLAANAVQYLQAYLAKNLPEFTGDINTFVQWADQVDVAAIAKDKPKFPMYIAAARLAHGAIYGNQPALDKYLASIKDIAMPALDAEFGSTVTDPSIFRKLPYYWERKFDEDMAKLNVLPSTITTRVSEYIPDIIEYVDKIITNGFAYVTSDGSVYFDTAKFENDSNHDYAKLQPWNKGDMSLINDGEGSLSSGQATKKNPADFALWKASKPGEPSWSSKWGDGRPGWHIECSVMASDITGETMDIHSGGVDLCFPHHDNELAQSEAYFNNKQWVNYFLHNGHLHIQGQKMSKSLKNFITIEQALKDFSSRQLRLVFALSSWDKPLDFKDSLIHEVKSFESSFSKFFTNVRALNNDYKHKISEGQYVSKKVGPKEKQLYNDLSDSQTAVHLAFSDNLSTSQALRVIQDLVTKTNTYLQETSTGESELRIEVVLQVTNWIVKILNILGFETRSDKLGWVDSNGGEDSAGSKEDVALPYVKAFSQFRDNVRTLAINKSETSEFLKATDAIRQELVNLGVSLDDRPNGSALVKFLNEQEKLQLIQQQEEKERGLAEKEKKKQQQQAANAKKEAERLAKMKVNPKDLFKNDLYSEWDESGLPTKDKAGEEVTKSMKKKLLKQYQQQEKLYQEWLKLGGEGN